MRWKKCVQCAAGGPKSAVWQNPAAAVYPSHGTPEYSFMIKQQKCGKQPDQFDIGRLTLELMESHGVLRW